MRTLFLVAALLLASTSAMAQSRRAAPAATQTISEGSAEGSGEAVLERAHNPNANTAVQPERSEGNEDDIDQNEGDDSNNGTGGN